MLRVRWLSRQDARADDQLSYIDADYNVADIDARAVVILRHNLQEDARGGRRHGRISKRNDLEIDCRGQRHSQR